MLSFLSDSRQDIDIPIEIISETAYADWLSEQPETTQNWLNDSHFTPKDGNFALIPGGNGSLNRVLYVSNSPEDPWSYGNLPMGLPAGSYYFEAKLDKAEATAAVIGWGFGAYSFDKYMNQEVNPSRAPACLVVPDKADRMTAEAAITGTYLTRDLINTPTCDMGPEDLQKAAEALAREFKAECSTIIGDDLVKQNYPSIFAVGKASGAKGKLAPRLIDIRWGKKQSPKVTLVGKGVCFDTGGLDIKPSNSMRNMKKDMGGAAHVLGLARMIMMTGLDVNLRVMIPAVENAISADAFRPGDILATREGLSVEVGNTDAEGRLVLSDALTEAKSDAPEIVVDFATLTGAARVALGPDLPATFCNDDTTAAVLEKTAENCFDPLWRLPLWQPYKKELSSKVADLCNITGTGFGGAITAALFLEHFVEANTPWIHIDTFGWAPSAKPGRPIGAEAYGIRAVYGLLEKKYG